MLIDAAALRAHRVRPVRVLHCGAHHGQESALYRTLRVRDVIWIEANPHLIATLTAAVPDRHTVINACLTATTGEHVTLNIAESVDGSNEGQSSSLLPLGTHADKHPEVSYVDRIETTGVALDDLIADHAPKWFRDDVPLLVNADLQGYELEALTGGPRILGCASWVYCEINVDELYAGCAHLAELDGFLVDAGFEVIDVRLAGCQRRDCSDGGNRWVGWGDALWARTDNPRPFKVTHPDLAADWYTNVERADGG